MQDVSQPFIKFVTEKRTQVTEKEIAKSLSQDQAQAAVLFLDTQHISEAIAIAKANANLNKRGLQLLGGDTLYSNTTLTQGGKAVEGLVLAVPWFRETPQSKNFAQAAAQQWGGGINWRTATSFDATQAFIKAFSPNPSRETVLQRLKQVNLSKSETSGDILKFTNGKRPSQTILVTVQKDKFVLSK